MLRHRAKETRRLIGLAALLLGTLFGALPLLDVKPFASPLWLAIGAVIGSVLFGLCSLSTSNESLLGGIRLPKMFLLYSGIVFGLLSVPWSRPQGGPASIINSDGVPSAMILVAAGLLAFTIGAVCATHRAPFERTLTKVRDAALRPTETVVLRFPTVAVWTYCLGLTARLFAIATGSYAYFANPTKALTNPTGYASLQSALESFCRYGIIIAAIDAFAITRSARARVTLAVLVLVEIPFAAVSGVKGEVVFTFVAIAIVYYAARERWPWRGTVVLVLVVIALVPLNSAYREMVRGDPARYATPLDALPDMGRVFANAFDGQNGRDIASGTGTDLATRFRLIDSVALVMQRTPTEIPYVGTTELARRLAVSPVPRAIFPTKNVLSTGLSFSQQYYQLPASLQTASAITIYGDLYRYGGIPSLLLGMFVLGVAVRVIDRRLHPRIDIRYALAYYALFVAFMNVENDVVSLFAGAIQTLLVTFVLSAIVFRSRETLSRAARPYALSAG